MAEKFKDMESCLYLKDIVGAIQAVKAGLGMRKHTTFYKTSSFEKRKFVLDEIRTIQEEIHHAKVAGFAQLGVWMKWGIC